MKKLFLSILAMNVLLLGYAQEEADSDTIGWNFGGLSSLNFSQVSLYQWAAGGESSLAGAALVNVYGNYLSEHSSWENRLDLAYGLIRQGDLTKKIDDRIEFSSQYGREASESWAYSGLLNFRSQFTEGYNYPNDSVRISNFFAPAYLTGSVGMNYKKIEGLDIFISPLAGKFTFVLDDSLSAEGQFGVDPGKQTRAELGGFIKISYEKKNLVQNVDLITRIDLFSNYLDKPQSVDVNWEMLLAMKINEYLSANISIVAIYDEDINVPRKNEKQGPGWQLKEVLGIGFSYRF